MMNDVRFLGGHGTNRLDGSRDNPYNNTHTADPDLNRRWDGQYPSLWVTDGGGGTFFDIWTPSTFAQAGMLVSDTSTEGRVYEMSSEHHVRHEVQLRNVSNWRIYALQTEEERGEGGFALPLEIDGSSNITVSNFHIYRVISSFQPFPWAIKVSRLEEHPLPQHPLLQQQQSLVRRCGLRPDAQRRDSAARVRLADPFRQRACGLCQGAIPGARGRRQVGEAGGRLLQHLRRRGRSLGRFLFRRRPLAAHLPLVGRQPPALHGARQSARPDQSGLRSGRQPDGDFVRRQRDRLLLQAGIAG